MYQPGTIVELCNPITSKSKEYKINRTLAIGGFSIVYHATEQQTGNEYVLKSINTQLAKRKQVREFLKSEIAVHQIVDHKNIVMFHNVLQDKTQNISLLLEYFCGCNNRNLRPKQIKKVMIQILEGVKYLHQRRVMHGDLKLGNILINEKCQVKICDFGFARYMENQKSVITNTKFGTPNYITPEMLTDGRYGYATDIWCIGIIMYTLLFGKGPFYEDEPSKAYTRIKQLDYSFPECSSVESVDLIKSVLVLNPEERPTIDQLLNHPYFTIN
jgi:serine/threonine protein kinase